MTTVTLPEVRIGTWQVDKVHSHIGFAVRHMAVGTFRSQFESYGGTLVVDDEESLTLEGWVDPTSVVAKDENLAAHLQAEGFFDTASYPRITFTSTSVEEAGDGEVEIEGDLTIKGRTQSIIVTGTISGPHTDIGGGERIAATLRATVDRHKFGLDWNAPLPKGGMALGDEVDIEVELELVKVE